MSIEKAPMVFHTDFDGTAVEAIEWGSERIREIGSIKQARVYAVDLARNMAKYPLAGVPGYGDFVRGVRDTGIAMGGIITRRRPIRTPVTEWSARNNGLYTFFGQASEPASNRVRHRVVYARTEMGKATQIAQEATRVPVAFIDDKPHKVGAELLKVLVHHKDTIQPAHRQIVMGVVDHPKADERMDRLFASIHSISGDIQSISFENGIGMVGDNFQLEVVRLRPYSYESGQRFGQQALGICGLELVETHLK